MGFSDACVQMRLEPSSQQIQDCLYLESLGLEFVKDFTMHSAAGIIEAMRDCKWSQFRMFGEQLMKINLQKLVGGAE